MARSRTERVTFIQIPKLRKGNGLKYEKTIGSLLREIETCLSGYLETAFPVMKFDAAEFAAVSDLTLARRIKDPKTRVTLMAVNGEVIGMVMNTVWTPKQVSLWNFIIREKFRGKGYGRQFMDHILTYHKKRGCEVMNLNVHSTNPKARAMYEEFGFKPIYTEMYLDMETHNVQ